MNQNKIVMGRPKLAALNFIPEPEQMKQFALDNGFDGIDWPFDVDIGHAYGCEAVESQTYAVKDFITPHADRVVNEHIYHRELPGVGHIPPRCVEDFAERLDVLKRTVCDRCGLALRNSEDLLKTTSIVEEYLKYCFENGDG